MSITTLHTQGQVITFIEKVFGQAKLTNNGMNANVLCPVCHENAGEEDKKKLAIRTDNWVVHCWVCGYKAKTVYGLVKRFHPSFLEEFLKEFNGASFVTDTEEAETEEWKEAQKLALPHGFMMLVEYLNHNSNSQDVPWPVKQAKNYLYSRGLSYEDLWYFKFGVSEELAYKNRVIIPSHDANGILNFFTSRAVKQGMKPKYFNPKFKREDVVFNELNVDWDEELTLVEGPFDLVKCNQNATCLLGKELTEHYRLFQEIVRHKTPVVLALDADAKQDAAKIAKLLLSYDVQVRIYQYPTRTKDPGDMSKTQFTAGLETARVYSDWGWLRQRLTTI